MHDVAITDNIYNPLFAVADEFKFATFKEFAKFFKSDIDDKDHLFSFELGIQLSGLVKIESRTRYTIWDLLGDVGGLSDGLHLITAAFMGLYAGMAFEKDYLDKKEIDDRRYKSKVSQRFK